MILKFRSNLGHIVQHTVKRADGFCLITTKEPSLIFRVTMLNVVYLVGGTYCFSVRRRLWYHGERHLHSPSFHLGQNAEVIGE